MQECTNSKSAAWAAVSRAENADQGSLAADRAGALTGELYETHAETEKRERREERLDAVSARANTTLNVVAHGTGIEINAACKGQQRAGNTRLSSAARGAFESLIGRAAEPTDGEPDCVFLDLDPTLIEELAVALRLRGYTNVVVEGESWSDQVKRIESEYSGQYPIGGGNEDAYERDLCGTLRADFPANSLTLAEDRRG